MKYDNSPAWSLAPRLRKRNPEAKPGPGAYNPATQRKTEGGTLAAAARSGILRKDFGPGPGAYSPGLRESGSAPSFGYGGRYQLINRTLAPGPGAYQMPKEQKGPSFAMTGRGTEANKGRTDAPGPGHYPQDIKREVVEMTPLWSFGKEHRGKQRKTGRNSPGPGKYDPNVSEKVLLGRFGEAARGTKSARAIAPGPGAYELPSTNEKQAFTMTSRGKAKSRARSPGPGDYNPQDTGGNAGFSVSRSPRTTDKKATPVPGPGTYTVPSSNINPTNSFGSEKRPPLSRVNSGPGPGAYKLGELPAGPQYPMEGRSPTKRVIDAPGPGQYDQRIPAVVVEKGPYWSFAKDEKGLKLGKKGVPGPGEYSLKEGQPLGAVTFGGGPRDKALKKDGPGPGAYDLPSTNEKLAFTLTSRHGAPKKESHPGPGAYNPQSDPGSPAFRLGSSARSALEKPKDVPGPGAYEIHPSDINPTRGFGSEQRPPLSRVNSVPGPGAYKPGELPSGPQYPMVGRYSNAKMSDGPGPGQYDQRSSELVDENGPNWSFGKDLKGLNLGKKGVPGPGQYDPKEKKPLGPVTFPGESRAKSPKKGGPGPGAYDLPSTNEKLAYSLTSRPGPSKKEERPGPGAYQLTDLPTGPQYPMEGRSPPKKFNNVPGPGHYDQRIPAVAVEKGPNWSFAKDDKGLNLGKMGVPGPGEYDPKNSDVVQYGRFGASARSQSPQKGGPGPGTYDLPSTNEKASFSLTSRQSPPKREGRPGPGAYNPVFSTTAPQFTIASAVRRTGKPSPDVPGPGQYNPHLSTSPSAKFGSEQRVVMQPRLGTPGPGAYEAQQLQAGPKFTMNGREGKTRRDEGPGPGQYFQDGDKGGNESGTFNFGKETRDKPLPNSKKPGEGVGPGMYHWELPHSPPHWSFGSQPRGSEKPRGPPGPGQYDIPTTIAVVAPYYVPFKSAKS